MNIDNESDNQREQSSDAQPVSSMNVGEINARRDPNNSSDKIKKRKRKPMTVFECLMVALTILAIAVAGLTGAAIYWQAQIGAETLREIKKGGEDTHTLAESAKKQAENTARQLPIAETQAKAAQDSVKAIQRQMRQDQRAWLKISFATSPLQDNAPIPIMSELINMGKTPAKNIRGTSSSLFFSVTKFPNLFIRLVTLAIAFPLASSFLMIQSACLIKLFDMGLVSQKR